MGALEVRVAGSDSEEDEVEGAEPGGSGSLVGTGAMWSV